MIDKNICRLYLVTDSSLMSTPTLEEAVTQAVSGGCTMIQLREKELSSREFYYKALSIKKITDRFNVPLIINDRVDIALACGANGVHLGQSDMPLSVARKIMGEDKIIGVTAPTQELALQAEKEGADYVGVGAIFGTTTKTDAKKNSIETLKQITSILNIPVVAIGGINHHNVSQLKNSGISGIAVVSSIIASDNIKRASEEMLTLLGGGII